MPIPIEMPKLSDTMTEGTLVKWKKKEGDKVEIGDILAEVETDKATMEMEAFDEGVLAKILIEEGQKVVVGGRLGILLEEGEDASAISDLDAPDKDQGSEEKQAKAPEKDAKKPESKDTPEKPSKAPAPQGRLRASPLARKVAKQHGVDLSTVSGSGPGGRIVAKDVLVAATSGSSRALSQSGVSSGAASAEDRTVELSGMRRAIASRLQESKQEIPHFYLTISVDTAALSKLRKQINTAAEAAGGAKVTVNDFVLLAAARAAGEHPKVNASWNGESIIEYANVHLSVAVAIEDGLITPVIRNADKLSLKEISSAVRDLAGRARSKKLKPEEYQGGTLTVSNLGAYGVEQFSAIINPPQAFILAVGAIVKQPVVNDNDDIVAGQRMAVTLSGDHRVIDGAVGAEYLQTFRKFLENPALMLF